MFIHNKLHYLDKFTVFTRFSFLLSNNVQPKINQGCYIADTAAVINKSVHILIDEFFNWESGKISD